MRNATRTFSPFHLLLTTALAAGCGAGGATSVGTDEAALTPTCAAACSTGVVCGTTCTVGAKIATCGSASYACSGGPTGDAATCYNGGNAPAFTTATSWSQLTGDQQAKLTTWMNNAASNWAGGSVLTSTPISATPNGDGFFRSVGSAFGVSDLGMVVWNNAANCAFFISTSDKVVPSSARALYDRWNALGGLKGPLGLPVSNAHRRDLVNGYDNAYQQFARGIVTFRSAETVAHAVGGSDAASKALVTEYLADQGIVKSLRPKLATPLASDEICVAPGDVICTTTNALAFRADSYPDADGTPRHYFAERNSSSAFTLKGAVGAKYAALARANGGKMPWTLIGFPVDNGACTDAKCSLRVQRFARANIYATSAIPPQSFVVDRDLLGAYLAEGGPATLGPPDEDSPSLGGTTVVERQQRFGPGNIIHVFDGGWTVAPPPPGPSQLWLVRNTAKPDHDHPEKDHQIGLTWYNASTSATTIYRQVCDGAEPQPSCTAYAPIANLGSLPVGYQGWTDPDAAMNAQNCYFVSQPEGRTVEQCAFTRDGYAHVPARLQLAVTVGSGSYDGTNDPVYARLQGVVGYPVGNITWLDTNLADFSVLGGRYLFDLNTFGKVNDMSDVDLITLGVAGTDALCIAKVELLVDDCGAANGCGATHRAYYKDYVADTGHCVVARGSDDNGNGGTLVTVSFHDLRTSPDWVRETTPVSGEVPGSGWHLGHFMGIYDANAMRGLLMGLAANSFRAHDITYQDSHAPIEVTRITTPPSPGGAYDERLRLKAHVHHICDAWAQFDVVLKSTCTCNAKGQKVVSKVALTLENASGDVESFYCQLGEDLLSFISGLFTAGYYEFDDWLQDLIHDKIMHALGGGKSLSYDIGPDLHFGFTSSGGFSLNAGTICDDDQTQGQCM